ncbi:MAG: hypothetical protein AMJ75_00140 [Phycisphaerae bacterium SM1_79]|nr:MAG: hypothetical protein AMJ75_00140 [Phycisphaerae bacterium SM1_79]
MGKSCLATTLVIIALLFCWQMSAEAGQNSEATVHIDLDTATADVQTSRTASVDDIFDVDIVIKGAVNLKAFNLVVTFPEAILEIQDAGFTEGDLFPDPNVSLEYPEGKSFFMEDLDTPGKAQLTGIIMSSDDAVTGEGVLFRMRCKVLSTEQAVLQFLAEDIQVLQDSTGARPEAIDDPVALGTASGATINGTPCDINGDGFRSIIGDVPPFVDCVYFGNCPPDVGNRCDINGDGFTSIIGDVPPFVDCVYFGNCPE